ncbi:MAG: DUF4276 family protein [Deltaproteobacteria bacterium]|nr:DUF4276 family protein [Deltaproteobacteria bacterium]
MEWFVATEDDLSNALASKMVHFIDNAAILHPLGKKTGFGQLKSKIASYCRLAEQGHYPVIVITDLDDTCCAPSMKNEWIQDGVLPAMLIFRIAVREAEAWLLADSAQFAKTFGVSEGKIPRDVETLTNPKEQMLALLKKHGNRKSKALLPRRGCNASVSLEYNRILTEFVTHSWHPQRARKRSQSLSKTLDRIAALYNKRK